MDAELPSPSLGTRFRNLFEALDGDVAKVYTDLGIADYRTRFSPLVRALVARGPMSIRELARSIDVTHSAASQTVAQMSRCDLVTLAPGVDARQRIVHLTERARSLLPIIQAEWQATVTAMRELEAELPFPLTQLVEAVMAALDERPFRQRIAEAARAHGANDPAARAIADLTRP